MIKAVARVTSYVLFIYHFTTTHKWTLEEPNEMTEGKLQLVLSSVLTEIQSSPLTTSLFVTLMKIVQSLDYIHVYIASSQFLTKEQVILCLVFAVPWNGSGKPPIRA